MLAFSYSYMSKRDRFLSMSAFLASECSKLKPEHGCFLFSALGLTSLCSNIDFVLKFLYIQEEWRYNDVCLSGLRVLKSLDDMQHDLCPLLEGLYMSTHIS
jgi:hypothetical protein